LLTVQYPSTIAPALPQGWSLAEVLLSSSYNGFGTASLKTDVSELSKCVSYFRQIGKTGKIVLMGHSTGCQDVLEYLVGSGASDRAKINGGILQGGVSDREALAEMSPNLEQTVEEVRKLVEEGKGEDALGMKFTQGIYGVAPVTARRFLSLASRGGDDDYFSSDLPDEALQKSLGSLPQDIGLCILVSGSDAYIPEKVDKEALLERWLGFARRSGAKVDGNSVVVEGASHSLNGDPEEVVQRLVKRVVGFLTNL